MKVIEELEKILLSLSDKQINLSSKSARELIVSKLREEMENK